MAGQTFDDGAEWAFDLFTPSALSIVIIHLIEAQYGPIRAGFASLILTVIVFEGILQSLKYWHIPSTAGFLFAGFILWHIIPDATADVVPWPFRTLQTIIIALFFMRAVVLFLGKNGIEVRAT